MPPDGKLDEQTLAYVREWIELGAPDPRKSMSQRTSARHAGPDASMLWSVQPLVRVQPPLGSKRDVGHAMTSIDSCYVIWNLKSLSLREGRTR